MENSDLGKDVVVTRYYYAEGNEQRGPVAADVLPSLGVHPDTVVWCEGMTQWCRADAVPELAGRLAPAAPPGVNEPPPMPASGPVFAMASTGPARELGYQSAYGPGAPSNGPATASMILGIVASASLLLGCMWYLAIPCGVLAVIFGYQAKAKVARGEAGGRGYAMTGIITGFVALGLCAAAIVALLVMLGIALAAG